MRFFIIILLALSITSCEKEDIIIDKKITSHIDSLYSKSITKKEVKKKKRRKFKLFKFKKNKSL